MDRDLKTNKHVLVSALDTIHSCWWTLTDAQYAATTYVFLLMVQCLSA